MDSPKRIYLDYAAATPLDPDILEKMLPYFNEHFGNAGGLHHEGRTSKRVMTEARERIAHTMEVRPEEIIFTASGTEGNNLAIFGFLAALKKKEGTLAGVQIITCSAEHPSVLDCFRAYEAEGVSVLYLNLDGRGLLNPKLVRESCTPQTRFVSVAYVNNEIGTVQPIAEIARELRAYEKEQGTRIVFHTDASQAPLYLDCRPKALGVELMTIDGQKIYGPKGVGFLFKRKDTEIVSIMKGGNQEFGLRPGTENIPMIVGIAESFVRAAAGRAQESARIRELQDYFIEEIRQQIPEAVLNGDRKLRSPANVNISIPGLDNEYATVALDERGIAVATKSACLGYGNGTSSYVVSSLSGNEALSRSSLRLTIGRHTKKEDLGYTVGALADIARLHTAENLTKDDLSDTLHGVHEVR